MKSSVERFNFFEKFYIYLVSYTYKKRLYEGQDSRDCHLSSSKISPNPSGPWRNLQKYARQVRQHQRGKKNQGVGVQTVCRRILGPNESSPQFFHSPHCQKYDHLTLQTYAGRRTLVVMVCASCIMMGEIWLL